MQEAPKPHNIDFEVQRDMLKFEHRWSKRGGIAQIIIGTAIGIVGIGMIVLFLVTFHIPSLKDGNLWLLFVLLALFTLGLPFSLIPAGLKTVRKAEQPIADTEVEERRQQERSQLFTQAQGQLPVEYTPRGQRNAILLGGGMVLFFAIVLVAFWEQPFPLWLFGRIFGIAGVLTGLLFSLQPLVYNRRAAAALQRQSAAHLRQRLTVEEHEPGVDSQQADSE